MRRKFLWGYLGIFLTFFCLGFAFDKGRYKPVMSVVTPTYNRADLLPRAIDSILNQTFQDFEFIIVDDGSTDKTAEILTAYAKKDKRIRVLKNKKNCGISCSRNRGQDAARGMYISILDSDDQALPNMLAKQIDIMQANPKLVAVSGGFIYETDSISSFQNRKQDIQYRFGMTPGEMSTCMLFSCCMRNVGAVIRRSFIEKNNIRYDTGLIAAEDYDYWKQILLKGGKLAVVQDALSAIRFHHSNGSDYYQAMTDNSLQIKKELFKPYWELDKTEQSFGYTEPQKCQMLVKLLDRWNENGWLNKQDVEAYIKQKCSLDDKALIY